MTVRLLQPDRAPFSSKDTAPDGDASAFARAVDAVGAIFSDAKRAEDAFAHGTGSLREATYERARADVVLAVAVAAAQRTAQAIQTVLSMQI
jgi:flagellar hook-basal body complex protein FliE